MWRPTRPYMAPPRLPLWPSSLLLSPCALCSGHTGLAGPWKRGSSHHMAFTLAIPQSPHLVVCFQISMIKGPPDLPFLNRSPVLSQSFSPFSFFWTALTTQHYKFPFFPLECKFHVRNFYSLLYPQHLKQYQIYNSGLYLLMKNQNCGT